MPSPIGRHQILKKLIELPAVFAFGHVDEVHANDSAHIAQTKLASNFFGSHHVDSERVFFLAFAFARTVARIHINDVHRLRVLDHQVGALAHVHGAAECALHLPVHTVVLKHRNGRSMKLDDSDPLGSDGLDVALDVFEEGLVVHYNLIKTVVERVAQVGRGSVHFAKYALLRFGTPDVAVKGLPAAY